MVKEFTTSRCHEVGHPEFVFKVDTSLVLQIDVDWFTATLESMVAGGSKFVPGQTIQIGWGLLKVGVPAEGRLRIFEPGYTSKPPIEFVDTVTQTLSHLRVQKDVLESYFEIEEIAFPSLSESCIVCTNVEETGGVVMDRTVPEPPDSGWFIGCTLPSHDHDNSKNLARVSVYEAVQRFPAALGFLALPSGVLLTSTLEEIRGYFDDAEVTPRRSSYIARLLETRG